MREAVGNAVKSLARNDNAMPTNPVSSHMCYQPLRQARALPFTPKAEKRRR
jgi:hypothetical protein